MDKVELTARIKREAYALGFEACCIASADPFPGHRLDEWLSQGRHGAMAYMERHREKRLDPSRILPGVRSVISVALVYRHAEEGRPHNGFQAVVARYARGRDYHEVMKSKLEKLLAEMKKWEPGLNGKVYVDTGPVLEKAWAARAGLGWQAKNTNILNRRLGSWFFLGELLVDGELCHDSPAADHCGSCTRCIDACPTGAITPYVLDSRLCISYLTIELRQDIPDDLRGRMGNLVFGCDICQDVCPWNRKAPLSKVEEFRGVAGAPDDLRELALVTADEFTRIYRLSAVKRAKWAGFLRNIAVGLGNSRNPAAVPALEHLLENPDPMVSRHAGWALDHVGVDGTDPEVQTEARASGSATVRTSEAHPHRPGSQGKRVDSESQS